MEKIKKKYPSLLGLIFRIIALLASTALIISYFSLFINPAISSIPLLFGLFFIPILLLNIILIIILALSGSKISLLPLIAILPSFLFANLFIGFNSNDSNMEKADINIISYNIGMLSSSRNNLTKEECLEPMIAFIKKQDADIVCLQEIYINSNDTLNSELVNYPYNNKHLFQLSNGDYFGNITLSKFPIKESGTISFFRSTNLSIFSDIEIDNKIIRVYNNHLESYNLSFTSLIKKSIESKNSKELANEIKGVHEKLNKSLIKRSAQVNNILKHIKESKYPTIICGDFNDTPMSYTYHKLSKNKKDSFKEAGSGFSATYSQVWPLLRIDYILVPAEYDVVQHKTIRTKLSDHYPISAKINL